MKVFNAILALCAVVLVTGCVTQTNTEIENSDDEGRLVIVVTDAAANMNAVTAIDVSIDDVEVYSATQGWIRVSSSAKNVDLLELKAESREELVTNVNLQPGSYNQIRFQINSVQVSDDEGKHTVVMPSRQMTIDADVSVTAGSTSSAKLDFIADESLYMTSEGEYVFAPVVEVETRSEVVVDVNTPSRVQIQGGVVRTSDRVGMDLQGNVGVNVRVPSNVNITINNGLVSVVSTTNATGNINIQGAGQGSGIVDLN